MNWSAMFFFNSILFGVGLAMDAFSVSMANGLRHPAMNRRTMCLIAGVFGIFQTLMPLIGWLFVHTVTHAFQAISRYIPLIALLLLAYIGGKMIWEGFHHETEEEVAATVGLRGLLLQGVATSIDALSVGFTIADDLWYFALTESLIIGVVTFFICLAGLRIGRRFGTLLADKASILGGLILVAIGLEIFIKSLLH